MIFPGQFVQDGVGRVEVDIDAPKFYQTGGF